MGSYSSMLLFLHLLIGQSLGIIFPQDRTESSSAYSEKFFDSSSSSSTGSVENNYYPLVDYGSPLQQKDATQELRDDQPQDKGWNYLDTSSRWTPHEKTISFQYLDDDGKFSHSPPAWPHDEYLTQFPQGGYYNSFKKNESEPSNENYPDLEYDKDYEWKRLRPRPPKSMFIGPGFYDEGSQQSLQQQQQQHGQTHQSITESSASASASAGDGQVPNAVSESNTNGNFYGGSGSGGARSPYDDYRRKRLRLKIHPGLLVAPIAGFAAYKAVSAIASKPLMLELGWVNNRPNVEFGGGGWGWNQNPYPQNPYPQNPYPQNPYPQNPYPQNPYPIYPPPQYYPPIVSPLLPNPYPSGVQVPLPVDYPYPRPLTPKYPILRPQKKPQDQKSAWWNPFSALTPRFRTKKERAKADPDCCEE